MDGLSARIVAIGLSPSAVNPLKRAFEKCAAVDVYLSIRELPTPPQWDCALVDCTRELSGILETTQVGVGWVTPVIAIVGTADQGRAALRAGASSFISAPNLSEATLRSAVENALAMVQTANEVPLPSPDLMQDVRAVIFECDARTWEYTYVSPQTKELLGYPVSRWLEDPKFWESKVLHPEDRDQAINACLASTRDGKPCSIEYRALRADGEVIWIRDLVQPVLDGNGEPLAVRGVMFDITKEKRLEADLRANEERFRQLANASNDVFWITDFEPERITYVSPAFKQI